MRLLVVRCLTCAVVQALMRPRVNAGVNAGTLAYLCSACRAESIFKATAGLSVCVSTVTFGLPWRGFGLFGKLGRQNVSRLFGRVVCFAGVELRGTGLRRWSGRSLGRWVGTE